MLIKEGWESLAPTGSGIIDQRQMQLGIWSFGLYYMNLQVDEIFFNIGLKPGEHMDKKIFLEFLANFDKVQPSATMNRRFSDNPPSHQLEAVMRWGHILTFIMGILILSMLSRSFDSYSGSLGECHL